MSEWLSLKDLIQKAAKMCPPGTPIPSETLVHLQFVPRNKYTHRAQNFTQKFPVQYKLQVRPSIF